MTVWFEAHTIQQLGRFHVVEPTVVVEIAFDVIHRSNRHDSGFALRFPRIFRLRPDKDVREIDTLSNVEALYQAARIGTAVQRPDRGRGRAAGMSDPDADEGRPAARADPGHRRRYLPRHGLPRSASRRDAAAMREADDWELRVGRADGRTRGGRRPDARRGARRARRPHRRGSARLHLAGSPT